MRACEDKASPERALPKGGALLRWRNPCVRGRGWCVAPGVGRPRAVCVGVAVGIGKGNERARVALPQGRCKGGRRPCDISPQGNITHRQTCPAISYYPPERIPRPGKPTMPHKIELSAETATKMSSNARWQDPQTRQRRHWARAAQRWSRSAANEHMNAVYWGERGSPKAATLCQTFAARDYRMYSFYMAKLGLHTEDDDFFG